MRKAARRGSETTQELTFEVPAQPLHRFGLVDENGADRGDSRRIRRRRRPDSRRAIMIETVDGKPIADEASPTSDGSGTPETLPDYLRIAADGRARSRVARRRAADQGAEPKSSALRFASSRSVPTV